MAEQQPNNRIYITRAGYELLERELKYLTTERNQEMTEQIGDAGDDTDIAEEGAFLDSIRERGVLDARINALKRALADVEIIDEDPDPNAASPGDRVVVWDLQERREETFDLLGSAEVAHGRGGVSIDSPVGRALLGKRVGDLIEVEIPDGKARYTIRRLEQIP